MLTTLRLFALATLFAMPALQAAEPTGDERVEANREFRQQFDAANYAVALPLAARVVELTRSQFGTDAPELANPLGNLGTTHYRMREFGLASDAYREGLAVLDLQNNATDPRLIPLLHGMGAALRGLQRDPEAIVPFKRAVDILRNRNGLYSPTQLPVLKQLIACYMVDGRFQDAGREQQYAFSIAESTYGKDDLRMLGPIDDYARWNEATGNYTAARSLYFRAVQVADAAKHGSVLAVDGLRGISRSYRLAFMNGESDESATVTAATMPGSVASSALPRAQGGPSSDGERALRNALQRLQAATPAQPRVQGEVLIDLGDWYLTAGATNRALPTYRDAWRALAPLGAQQPLETPVAIVYRAPPVAVSRKIEDPEKSDEQQVELRLGIKADGDVRDVSVTNPAPEREAAERAVMAAVKRATWRPAFRDGEPVVATDVVFRERVYVRKPKVKE